VQNSIENKQPEHWALVPVKSLDDAKQRLEPRLGDLRGAFSLAMLRDVLDALSRSKTIDAIAVVTEDPEVRQLAESTNSLAIGEGPSAGLNADVTHAVNTLQGMGAKRITVIHADLPLVTSLEIDRVCGVEQNSRTAATRLAAVICPSSDHQGTNVLSFDADQPIPFRYGPNSFNLHHEIAQDTGAELVTIESETLSIDIDEPSDFEQLLAHGNRHPEYASSASWRFLQRAGLTSIDQHDAPARPLRRDEIVSIAAQSNLETLCETAAQLRDAGHGSVCTYSPKIFLPITRLCRDFCHYCTFATTPKHLASAYMTVDEALEVARQGAAMGCREALFTLGEKPELRHPPARQALDDMGFDTTLDYVAHIAERVLDDTGLLPHINAGCMTVGEIRMLRKVSASMGLMLENSSSRLCEKGQVHYGSPDKDPTVRLQTLENAGREGVPFTTGILIGIGETREERLDSLLAIRQLHLRYGHIQEVIIQNFIPKADTKMANVSPPDHDELRWTVAMARVIFGPEMSIQAPPNLNAGLLESLVHAGINDWGGVSPLTPDHVNPESPWPNLDTLEQQTARAGKTLQPRLTIYPHYVNSMTQWLDPALETPVLKLADTTGLAREDDWLSGQSKNIPGRFRSPSAAPTLFSRIGQPDHNVRTILAKSRCGESTLSVDEISTLFSARGKDFEDVCLAAHEKCRQDCGDTVTYVVNRNINYTNICTYRCNFCAFAKGRKNTEASDAPYLKSPEEVGQLALDAWHRGATEVCLQGGIHPSFTGETYLDICSAVRDAVPEMHIHAFSPLEVTHGAETLGLSLREFLTRLKQAGLATLPGTAAEILCDDVRAIICPDKISTSQWLHVVETAHSLDLPTTSTIMFGHVDRYHHWARHLLELLHLQRRTEGITEFVPLPFVAQEAPIYRRGRSRRGPTFREAVLMHAVSRLVLSPAISNIQTSWVKMGLQGAKFCLQAGANDIGGTLMNESITRAAGARHGQEMTADTLEAAVTALHRTPVQRNTLYGEAEKKAYVAL